jgi:hypothetical protein
VSTIVIELDRGTEASKALQWGAGTAVEWHRARLVDGGPARASCVYIKSSNKRRKEEKGYTRRRRRDLDVKKGHALVGGAR